MLGLNTCWAGTFNRKKISAEVSAEEKLAISIAIGYGATQGKERKPKTVDQVVAGKEDRPDWYNYGVEMALLAPTAVNQQKFEITYNNDGSIDFKDKGDEVFTHHSSLVVESCF